MRVFFKVEELPLVQVGPIEMNELVASRHDAVVRAHVMWQGVLKILVIEARSPVARCLTLQDGNEAWALHVRWDR
jgi:hypothetical protein